MRQLPVLAVLLVGLGACTYVERERPAPVVLQQQPSQPTMVAPPPVVLRQGY